VVEVKPIPIQAIDEPWNLLRPVREQTLEFQELVHSIRDHGLLKPILVRSSPTTEGNYQLVDGLHRFRACKALHLTEVAVVIREMSDNEVLQFQITANANYITTSDAEFARQIQRLLQRYESVGQTLSAVEIAKMVGKSPAWVRQRLALLDLQPKYLKALDDKKIALGHAVELVRIKNRFIRRDVYNYALEHTVRETQLEAGRILRDRISKRDEERRDDYTRLTPRYRPIDDSLNELDSLENLSMIILRDNLTTPAEGAQAALEWMLGLDEQTRALKVTQWHERMSREERRAKLAKQRYRELEELDQIRKTRESKKN